MIISNAKMKVNNVKSTNDHIHYQVRYCARTQEFGEGEELKPIATNCAGKDSDELIRELQAYASLRPDLKKATQQVILSPEKGDRHLSPEEWQKAIDIYRQERGLEDAPYVAYLHSDGNEKRHPDHVHLFFCGSRATVKPYLTLGTQASIAPRAAESKRS